MKNAPANRAASPPHRIRFVDAMRAFLLLPALLSRLARLAELDEDIPYHRDQPAIAAAPTTRTAGSERSVPRPKITTVAKRAATPLPTSSQLTRITGAPTSKPIAPVALSRRCQAIQLASVATPATKKRRRKRAQGQAARAAAVSTPATMADTYVTDTPYISASPPRAPRAEPGYCCSRYTYTRTCSSSTQTSVQPALQDTASLPV